MVCGWVVIPSVKCVSTVYRFLSSERDPEPNSRHTEPDNGSQKWRDRPIFDVQDITVGHRGVMTVAITRHEQRAWHGHD
jgi:hypothetical protein